MKRVVNPRCARTRDGKRCELVTRVDDCHCCGLSTWDCPKCSPIEVRAGRRVVAPLRCMGCIAAGCLTDRPRCQSAASPERVS